MSSGLSSSCVPQTQHLYETQPFAPSFSEREIKDLDRMGPIVVDGGVNFAVYAEHATRIDVLLFDDPNADLPSRQFQMERFGDVWSLFVSGIGNGQHYGYVAWGPNWPFTESWQPGLIDGFIADVDADGNRYNPNKLLLDPYAQAVSREHDWLRASAASGSSRTQSTWGAGSKSIVVLPSTYAWSDNEAAWRAMRQDVDAPGHRFQDLIVYEVHAKGFTKDPSSGVEHPGSWRGIAEKAAYLKDLGVTAVEFLPVQEKPLDGGYWGYWTLNFFQMENSYSSNDDPLRMRDEFKAMVDALHQQGIEVVLDVVYNHTGEGGLWRQRIFEGIDSPDPGADAQSYLFSSKEVANIMSYRGLDNQAYYAVSPDRQTYWNNTGVGQDTRPNHTPMRRLIMDNLHYLVEEMHIDGFRFDLAGILGQRDGDYNNWDDPANTVLQDVIDDPLLQKYNTRVIAEPWTAGGNYGALLGAYPASSNRDDIGWGEWNGRFRDSWRETLNYDDTSLDNNSNTEFQQVMTGTPRLYSWNGRAPYHSVNFITSHDGFTLYDLFSFDHKMNSCGPLNPECCDNPSSALCDDFSGESNNRSRDWGMTNEPFKRQMMRNAFTAMLVAHGTPMLFGGDEWMRTQLGNNNAYGTKADNEWNWFRWGEWQANANRARMHDFVKKLVAFRKANPHAFARDAFIDGGAPFAWKTANNTDGIDWSKRHVMQHYYDDSAGPEICILYNMERDDVVFTLPTGAWYRVLDTQAFFDEDVSASTPDVATRTSRNIALSDVNVVDTGSYTAKSSSIVVLTSDPS